VIAPDAEVEAVLAELAPHGAAALDEERDAAVTVVPASAAKGLEYDTVVVVEPARIAAVAAGETSSAAGLRRLYVVLTRAVSRLVLVHDEPLPAELGELADSADGLATEGSDPS
jgi:superfamily I DNA/RNA helicase